MLEKLGKFVPWDEEEAASRDLVVECLRREPDVFERKNGLCHMTASAWIVNRERTKVLLAFHNLYQSWSWLGGHADGDRDLLRVALKEAREESGLTHVHPVSEEIFSVEVGPVLGHVKRGKQVPSHVHLNVTYLLEADESEALHEKPDENSAVGWFALNEVEQAVSERWMWEHVYRKLNEKVKALLK